ncbi:hypothetical protein [Caulobacter endophyticus]|uniref:hypothetical protein n=1 Tax=Caulobacter endophyticus TaxID=2172652 RepID=UPI0024105149|nr:hypothetical protein [Caulobacter endophyticus]MDG2528210.1 hypothetical protein [Caulobacter endophyticus]
MSDKRLNTRACFALLSLGSAMLATSALAQVTPSDVRDLIGARGSSGEAELASRGYVNTGVQSGDDRKWTYWWNARRGVCLSVSTVNGRYDSIVSTPAPDCRQGGGRADDDRGYRPPEFGYGRPGGGYREHIALVCYGEGQRMTNQMKSGYEWDSDKHRYVPRSGFELSRQDYDTSVTIEIDGGQGRIRPAKNMIPPLHSSSDGGWYDIANLSVSRDFIRGEFKLNGANRPKMTIDRRAGRITLDGLTKFSGTCDPLDGDRKF